VSRCADAGAVLSASHNPFDDNGIKLFGSNGKKLPDSVEDAIEAAMASPDDRPRPTGADIGRVTETYAPLADYVERVGATMRGAGTRPLAGMKLVVDCANGAAYKLAPKILRDLGAEIHVIHAEPDGVNINVDCGSTKPHSMAAAVRGFGTDFGLAFDGDADRVIMADENGDIVDGDRMMAILALHLHREGRLTGDVVVATIMSNVGLEQLLREHGIRLHRTDVGDRYVAEAMDGMGAAVGGEQSGHILLPDLSLAGDGLLTALQVLRIARDAGKPLSELAGVMRPGPQLLKNVRVKSQSGWREDRDILEAIAAGEARLGSATWLSVRASGTEPLIRVMAQGTDKETVEAVVHHICSVVERKLGG
jgi:phosphoglucosamine mutase